MCPDTVTVVLEKVVPTLNGQTYKRSSHQSMCSHSRACCVMFDSKQNVTKQESVSFSIDYSGQFPWRPIDTICDTHSSNSFWFRSRSRVHAWKQVSVTCALYLWLTSLCQWIQKFCDICRSYSMSKFVCRVMGTHPHIIVTYTLTMNLHIALMYT